MMVLLASMKGPPSTFGDVHVVVCSSVSGKYALFGTIDSADGNGPAQAACNGCRCGMQKLVSNSLQNSEIIIVAYLCLTVLQRAVLLQQLQSATSCCVVQILCSVNKYFASFVRK